MAPSPPRRLTFSLLLCVHRILPFSQCSRPSLPDLEWPLLTLSSSHLGGGWQIRPSGLLITTVSLCFTRIPLDTRNSKVMRHWGQWPGCSWTPWRALSLESGLSGYYWALWGSNLTVPAGGFVEWTWLLFLWLERETERLEACEVRPCVSDLYKGWGVVCLGETT